MSMEVGETRTFTIAPKDAYGEHLWQRVEKERFHDPESVEVGDEDSSSISTIPWPERSSPSRSSA